MEKEFIGYDEALDLKELGFDGKCGACYYTKFDNEIGYHKVYRDFNFVQLTVSAPTFSQAFRWFREKHSIQATIEPTKDQHRFELGFNYWIWNTKTAEEWFTEPKDRPAGDYVFDSYEEAELECLIKLIEIVKNK